MGDVPILPAHGGYQIFEEPEDSAVYRAQAEGQRAGGGCEGAMGAMRAGRSLEVFGGGILLRPRFAEGTRGAGGIDPHFVGWVARGSLDAPGSARGERRL